MTVSIHAINSASKPTLCLSLYSYFPKNWLRKKKSIWVDDTPPLVLFTLTLIHCFLKYYFKCFLFVIMNSFYSEILVIGSSKNWLKMYQICPKIWYSLWNQLVQSIRTQFLDHICTVTEWTLECWVQDTHTHNLRSALMLNGGLWTMPSAIM